MPKSNKQFTKGYVPPKQYTQKITPCPDAEQLSARLCYEWIGATTTAERNKVRDDIWHVQPRRLAMYVGISTVRMIAQVNPGAADWFMEFMHPRAKDKKNAKR